MNRRDFILTGAAGLMAAGTGTSLHAAAAEGRESLINHDAPPRNRRPYSGIDWATVKEVHTSSHCHCTNQKMLDSYLKRGFEFLTLSNYYPSAPAMYCCHASTRASIHGSSMDAKFACG